MTSQLDAALKRLEEALGLLEVAVTRRLDAERGRTDRETELQIMQDDRAQLALDLDTALARLHRFETAADEIGQRVERAMGAVRAALDDTISTEQGRS